ncbi:Eco57I restriction-modification methylase domain-containing protein [Staphylococcus epidermidis]|jgi:hypothetical protein|uniref:Eco57I restriction-modification methylase domain-containing protein n=4 Tax=Staphylococcus TaxID=1279 RepID=UPI000D1CE12C|nr:Eco57I restriction-modification methylase domain-containing protein [Staphylococcus epidermidis]MDU5197689.1 Eco57I restriction-modification methylase domain-containing protein [Enterobacter sichuanensis]HAK2181482.1 DEAD/DEAH box helicase family protein [Salmonella enterica]HCU7193956.1 Eco57I restriction-modification methylase domain-containing protein [Staphylococcus aureus]MBM6347764.1 Eco57I restriction-modification methylase domain-containing protein [Staphylococcus epidermidis]MCO621
MKMKYFDYLNKYHLYLDSFLKVSNIKNEIEFLRSSMIQSPSSVSIAVRRLAEITTRRIAQSQNIKTQTIAFFNIINYLYDKKIINKEMQSILHKIRKIGNRGAHGEIITSEQAKESLISLEKLFRHVIHNSIDKTIKVNITPSDQMFLITYATFERKLIYVQSADNRSGLYPAYAGLEKIGDASVPDEMEADFSPNSDYLRTYASKRINQYMNTAGVPYDLHWAQLAVDNKKRFFRDYDVHMVLKRSGLKPTPLGKDEHGKSNEWFEISVDLAKKAIKAVKEGKNSLESISNNNIDEIIFRPEQIKAIKETKKIFRTKDTMLWNAKMRFGKTLSALQVVKECGFKKVLIMTHRPIVRDGWFEDFRKIFNDNSYIYGSNTQGEKISKLMGSSKPFIYFASIQDLRGSKWAGGKQGNKNLEFLEIDWDLIIVDEAHEGNNTELANNIKQKIVGENTKTLELSGTPFNLLDKFDEDNIFTWDYTMEQEAKEQWKIERPNEPNPYEGLPKVSMYTFDITKDFKFLDENKAFNFKEFFKLENNQFIYKDEIVKFLDYITTKDEKNNYPFSKEEFRKNLRHTLWLLPGVEEVNAFEKLLKEHNIFKEYKIVNVVKDGEEDYANSTDLNKVRSAIGNDPSKTKTITLTVRKLTTGVNVPEWSGVLFLSNTESPTSYLQAAFRAQTPFNHETLGVKENCYVFDFAPDRALKIMSESVGLTSKKGKINTTTQIEKVTNMLNFLPILGQSGNGMKKFSVDTMLTSLKKAYAEKAVRSGFEDNSLYNDNLLKLDESDLSKFNNLKGIVGSTKAKKSDFVVVSENGFDEEQYDKAEKAEKKTKKERSKEEEEALNKLKALRKQRNAMISILRGISIRIPMMIYGMEVDIEEDITIDKFIDFVDEESWKEFMPEGLSKREFKKFTKYYDGEVFTEAGRITRQRARAYDKLDVLTRTEKIGELFSTFKNPDKETILTPWKVINRHLVDTIGGLSFYDESFENTTIEGKSAMRFVEKDIYQNVYRENIKVLDINSKTGLYPLFYATSLYYKIMMKQNDLNAGKFNPQEIWKKILKENIFAVAKTPMARTITQRTLAGYSDFETNIEYIDELVPIIEKSSKYGSKKIKEVLNNMKFDVIIGNPPYQEKDGGAQASARPIYQNFVRVSKALNPELITFIMPTRWYTGGKGLDSFRDEMLNDIHIRELNDWLTPTDIFPKTNIRGGICYFLWDKSFDNTKNLTRVITHENNEVVSDLKRPLKIKGENILIRDNIAVSIIDKVFNKQNSQSLTIYMSPRKPFGLSGNFIKNNEFHSSNNKLVNPIICYGKGRIKGYIEEKNIPLRREWINKWKLYTPRANNIGTELNDNNLNSFIGEPGTICTESYLVIGGNENLDKESCLNISKFLKTKFARYMHSLAKAGQDATAKTYKYVPLQNFKNNSDINWELEISEIDNLLFTKYELTKQEIEHIMKKISI